MLSDCSDRSRRFAIFMMLTVLLCASSNPIAADQPNLLIILADDMGYGDLGATGSVRLATPRLDELRQSGVLCTQAYVTSSVCSPSRAGLMTGRDPRRFGYQANLNSQPDSYPTRPELLGLPPGEHTLADHFRSGGYRTCLIGKWHLGIGAEFHPNARGFDWFSGMLTGSHSYFPDPQRNQLERNGVPISEFSSPYLTDFFTDESLAWLRQHDQKYQDQPWFMFLSYNAPHGPLQATEQDLAQFAQIRDNKRRTYAAMMLALDRGVGRVLDYLDATGQRNNTLVCFFSDNGGATNNASWNGPLSGVKGCLREGGIRVPMIWSWPGHIPAASSYTNVVSSLDLLPTMLAAAQISALPLAAPRSHEDASNRKRAVARYGEYDGANLLPVLRGEAAPDGSRTLFWRLQGQAAILSGGDKLVRLSHRAPQLFAPGEDVAEQQDRFTQEPDRVAELFEQLGEWESLLPTMPLWGSSPYWNGQSAKGYDEYRARPEPE